MIKNRTAQLIFQSFYCAIGIVATVASIGIFNDVQNPELDFYVHFTNLSNYLCIAIMFAELISTAKREGDGYTAVAPVFKFIGVLSILLTFFVFNILLAGAEGRDPQLNWRLESLAFHVVLPLLFVADWFLFYEHRKVRWFYPLVSIIFPLLYVGFVYIRAAILNFDATVPLIYPYFFLNLELQGIAGVLKWIGILLLAFVLLGYIFYGIDRLIKSK